MANTWHAASQAIAYGNNKYMIDLFHASGGSRLIKLYEIYLFNNQTSGVTGVVTTLQIMQATTGAPSGGSTITPVTHDSANDALPAQLTCGTGRTPTDGSVLRRIAYSNDEPAVGTGGWDELECLVPFARIWDEGLGDANIQPLTLRSSNQGISVKNTVNTTVGVADMEMVFTDEAA
jgi:hypothetical protein